MISAVSLLVDKGYHMDRYYDLWL